MSLIQTKNIALIGLMGAGKSRIGRALAARLGREFADSDREIEAAAGRSVAEIFADFGEAAFRAGERRVLDRLLSECTGRVIATGGGAFMAEDTRAVIERYAICVWLRADIETLVARTALSDTRPLLKQGDPREILLQLIDQRYPVYQAGADIVVDSDGDSVVQTVNEICDALEDFGAV